MKMRCRLGLHDLRWKRESYRGQPYWELGGRLYTYYRQIGTCQRCGYTIVKAA